MQHAGVTTLMAFYSFSILRQLTFEFEKRRQLFIQVHNETLSIIVMCVSNPDRSLVGINR